MNSTPQNTGSYSLKKGETVFCEGRKVQSLNLLLQGRLDVFVSHTHGSPPAGNDIQRNSFKIFDIDQNIFLEANDIFHKGTHGLSCMAGTDCNLFGYDVKTMEQTMELVNSQKDYGAYILNSLCTLISKTHGACEKVTGLKNSLKTVSDNLAIFFWFLKEKYGFEYTPQSGFLSEGAGRLANLRQEGAAIPPIFSRPFIETETGKESVRTAPDPRIEYYMHLYDLPPEFRKGLFGADMLITRYSATDASKCLDSLLAHIKEVLREADMYLERLYSEEGENIYAAFMKAAGEIGAAGYDNTPTLNAVDYVISKIREILKLYETEYLHTCRIDLDYLEYSYGNARNGLGGDAAPDGRTAASAGLSYDSLPEELQDSAKKIIEYSGIAEERSDMFLMNLAAFRNLRDKLSTEESVRSIRNDVSSMFFEIYEAVLKKALALKDDSRLINMFLNYCYMDEKLLNPEQSLALYRIAGRDGSGGKENIHTARQWLTHIYDMKKDPSINEFGQDYLDIFREMKKRGQASEKDRQAYENNREARLSYEIMNMLKTNHKLCQGQISVYFPILHRDLITRDLEKSYITREAVSASLDRILEVDYSAFHREIYFKDTVNGIEKELIMKAVAPDVLLIPVFGSRSMMWQEISGRSRSTPGRFNLPAFTDENLDDIMIKLVGNFRWELCRTMMGAAWNDVTQPSLTSEYTDYIQFFKKNRDLSEEAKEKLKSQIQKYHNKTRDIFTADYELWINNEAKGNVRVNKVVRSILFKYCPFSKPIREQLDKQPIYTELSSLMRNQRAKIARDLENRYSRYAAKNGALDPDLEQNLIFYRNL